MIPLLADAIEAHGGLRQWKALKHLSATIRCGGDLWALKEIEQDQTPRTMRIDLHREWASLAPFGKPGQRTDFSPGRIAIIAEDGRVVAERNSPRASFARHDMRTHWDPLHRAYFNGYALWTCLTTPFLLAMEGFRGPGDRTLARRRRGLARTESDVPCGDRKPQHRAGFLFRPGHADSPA